MIPYEAIWDRIALIHQNELPYNFNRTKNELGIFLDDIIEAKDKFQFDTLHIVADIESIVRSCSPDVDCSFRYKEDSSIERNCITLFPNLYVNNLMTYLVSGL